MVDRVPATLRSWQRTLSEFGYRFSLQELQAYSGMDGLQLLDCLLPAVATDLKRHLLKEQGHNYRRLYLARAQPIGDVRRVFETLKRADVAIGIATTCQPDELDTYDSVMHVLDLVDVVTCGGEVQCGKPPDLFRTTLIKLAAPDPSVAVAVGDTPYDAKAAMSVGMQCIGVLTGGFTLADLQRAGCSRVVPSLARVPVQFEYLRSLLSPGSSAMGHSGGTLFGCSGALP